MRSIADIKQTSPTEPQLVEGLLLTDYLELTHMSGSCIVTGHKKSLLHLKEDYETINETTDAMRLGSLADALLFDSIVPAVRQGRTIKDAIEEFDEYHPVFTGKTRRGKEWDEFSETYGEGYFRTYDERQRVVEMATRIATNSVAAPYWAEGISQSTILTSEHGVLLKHRPDWISTSGYIVDMKTTQDVSRCSQTVRSFGYHIKMAMYRRALKLAIGKELPCVLIFVEQSPPYDVVVMPLDVATLDTYEDTALTIVRRVSECLESGEWPGVAGGEEMEYTPSYDEMAEDVGWSEAYGEQPEAA